MSAAPTCKSCGKYSNHLLDGVGLCCSKELQEQYRLRAEQDQRRRDLLWALQTRPLSVEEMGRVRAYDYHLLVQAMVPYSETELRKQFGQMLLNQFGLQCMASKAAEEKK